MCSLMHSELTGTKTCIPWFDAVARRNSYMPVDFQQNSVALCDRIELVRAQPETVTDLKPSRIKTLVMLKHKRCRTRAGNA